MHREAAVDDFGVDVSVGVLRVEWLVRIKVKGEARSAILAGKRKGDVLQAARSKVVARDLLKPLLRAALARSVCHCIFAFWRHPLYMKGASGVRMVDAPDSKKRRIRYTPDNDIALHDWVKSHSDLGELGDRLWQAAEKAAVEKAPTLS